MKVIKKISKKELKDFLYSIDRNDNQIYQEMNSNNGFGVFQFSGNTALGLVNDIKPQNFDEMVAINALARPGTISFASEYNANKKGDIAKYPKAVDELLSETRGLVLYQEQVMKIFHEVGGFTLEDTNCLTGDTIIDTNIGKKTIKEIVDEKLDVEALSFDEIKNEVDYKPIIDYFDNGEKEIFEIELENGEKIKATSNHKFLTKRGWVELCELTEDDELFHNPS